ncbi:hypothetical protein BBG06_02660 [Streptococcus dysgalactiae subsp. equisimilis]|nr:hypothetical protein BBG06_02660 [Streptococcus dysgalactiae subsp. equisimilis]
MRGISQVWEVVFISFEFQYFNNNAKSTVCFEVYSKHYFLQSLINENSKINKHIVKSVKSI